MTGITTTPHLHFQIDKNSSPSHIYWPYSFKDAADLGLDFFAAVNVGLGKENAIRYTIHPMEFIKKNRFLGSAPREQKVEVKADPIVVSSEIVADITPPTSPIIDTVVSHIETGAISDTSILKQEDIIPLMPSQDA